MWEREEQPTLPATLTLFLLDFLGGDALSDRTPLRPWPAFHSGLSLPPSHPTEALGGGPALTNSNSPRAGAPEIGIEDGLRKDRIRMHVNLCSWDSQPLEPTGEATALSQGAPSQLCFFPSARPLSAPEADSELSGSEDSGSLSSKMCRHESLRSKGPPKGQPASKCSPYLARLSHGVVVTLGLSGMSPLPELAEQGEEP